MATSSLSTSASPTAATADDRRTKADRLLDKEREKLKAKQAAVERAKEKQRLRIEAQKERARGGKTTPSAADAQTHSQHNTSSVSSSSSSGGHYSREEEEKTQEQCDAQLRELQWRRQQAERAETLRQAEAQMTQLRMEREQVEAEIVKRRRQVECEEQDRQQRIARDMAEEGQRQRQRQAQLGDDTRRRRAEEEAKEAMQREARRREQEDSIRRQAEAKKRAEEAAGRRQEETEQRRRTELARMKEAKESEQAAAATTTAAELSRLQQAEMEARSAAAAARPTVSFAPDSEVALGSLGGVVLPSWNIGQVAHRPADDAVLSTQSGNSVIESAAVLASPISSDGQSAASAVEWRPLSSLSSRPTRRSAWNIPVRPDSPSSVASAPSLLSSLASLGNRTSEQHTSASSLQRQARLHRRSLPAIPSSPFNFTAQQPSSSSASPSHSATSEPVSRRSSLITALPAPPRFSRQHLINAVTFSLLPSPSQLASRLTVLALLQSTPPAAHMLLMLHASPTSSLTLRAVFVHRPDSRDAASVWESGSAAVGRVVLEEELDRVWKYDSGKKTFVELPGVRSFTPTSHAFTLQKRAR